MSETRDTGETRETRDTGEAREARLKRMKMRSMRRGIREMDLILSAYAETVLVGMTLAELDLYDAMLSENDHDLYQWVSGQAPAPPRYAGLMAAIAAHQAELPKT